MFRDLTIEGYRTFKRLELTNLGRVNLLVGRNNAGKTSVLEAAYLLASAGDPQAFWTCLSRRNEVKDFESTGTVYNSRRRATLAHLFHATDAPFETPSFRIFSGTTSLEGKMKLGDRGAASSRSEMDYELEESEIASREFSLSYQTENQASQSTAWEVDANGFIPVRARVSSARASRIAPTRIIDNVKFVSTSSLTLAEVIELYELTVLTQEEALITESLASTIEATISRVAVGKIRGAPSADVLVRIGNKRVPLGTMGDGIRRILGLVLALIHSRDGYLFVDEIDTGLHYSALEQMWKLIETTSQRLNVQVLATTHSRDCVQSLATICQSLRAPAQITVQRIVKGQSQAVAYSESEIITAADFGMEVR